MHRRVTLRNEYGDEKQGVERQSQSDMPNTILCGSTRWYDEVWEEHGWRRSWAGDWEW